MLTAIVWGVLFSITNFLIIFVVKNYITYSISMKWTDDKYNRKDWYNTKLPSYDHLLYNLKVWKYMPLDEYNEKYK